MKRWSVYRALSISNDLSAAARGPVPLAKRLTRKQAHKYTGRILRSLMKGAGL